MQRRTEPRTANTPTLKADSRIAVVAGSWRHVPRAADVDVRAVVRDALSTGACIRTGGALGVDEIALSEAFSLDPSARQLEVVLPTPLGIYSAHYLRRAAEGVIEEADARHLIALLAAVSAARPAAVRALDHDIVDRRSYFLRNSALLVDATMLFAFQVDGSPGTQDTIDKASALGIPTSIKRYSSRAE